MRTMFALTDSLTPRRLTAATSAMNDSASTVISVVFSASSPKPFARLDANAREAVEALVIPEHITVNATMKVRKCTPNALCVYSAAPAAWGYLVTSSR
jgi:hypothetical protein